MHLQRKKKKKRERERGFGKKENTLFFAVYFEYDDASYAKR